MHSNYYSWRLKLPRKGQGRLQLSQGRKVGAARHGGRARSLLHASPVRAKGRLERPPTLIPTLVRAHALEMVGNFPLECRASRGHCFLAIVHGQLHCLSLVLGTTWNCNIGCGSFVCDYIAWVLWWPFVRSDLVAIAANGGHSGFDSRASFWTVTGTPESWVSESSSRVRVDCKDVVSLAVNSVKIRGRVHIPQAHIPRGDGGERHNELTYSLTE